MCGQTDTWSVYQGETAINYDFLSVPVIDDAEALASLQHQTELTVFGITLMVFSWFGRCDSQGADVVRTYNPAPLEQAVLRDKVEQTDKQETYTAFF